MQDSLTHADSRRKLLGNNPSKEIIDEFSNELQVDENTHQPILPRQQMIKQWMLIIVLFILKN